MTSLNRMAHHALFGGVTKPVEPLFVLTVKNHLLPSEVTPNTAEQHAELKLTASRSQSHAIDSIEVNS